MSPSPPLTVPAPPLTVPLLAQALYAEWRALGALRQRQAVEDAWRSACAKGLEAPWFMKAADVLAWAAVLTAPAAAEEQP